MSRAGGADDVTAGEVYANGIALDVVRGWLGATASDLDWDTFNDADDVDATRPRPCLLYTSPSPRDATLSRMPSSA